MSKPYWRSPDDLADTPALRALAAREFPGFANVYEGTGEAEPEEGDGPTRRQFLTLSAAALGLAGAAGCRRPDFEILPYNRLPEDVVFGLPVYYATTIPRPGGGFPVLVESHTGRPTKVEGNPSHPAGGGATDAHAQASVFDLYAPARGGGVLHNGRPVPWQDFDAFAAGHFARLQAAGGKGLRFLAEDVPSPSLRKLRAHIAEKFPQSAWHVYEPVGDANSRRGAAIAFGKPYRAGYRLDKAKRILAIDCDLLGLDPSAVVHARHFAAGRRAEDPGEMNRLYAVETTYTVTGMSADHRLRLPGSHVADYVVALARHLLPDVPAPAPNVAIPREWVEEVAADLRAHKGAGLICVGERQPAFVHALAHRLNEHLGNLGATVELRPVEEGQTSSIDELAAAIDGGEVQTLVILGGNPAYDAPASLDLAAKLSRV
ncbi:MAG TPA: TAT-variant-translocated molybdopterin oxidoreductase, partial [Gemmataceae bacterium]